MADEALFCVKIVRFPPALDSVVLAVRPFLLKTCNFIYVFHFYIDTMDIDLMSELLATHSALGNCTAELNWIRAGDPYGISNEFKNRSFDKNCLQKNLKLLKSNAQLVFSEGEYTTLMAECGIWECNTRSASELALSLKYIPPGFTFNDRALVLKTDKLIPEDIRMGLSFGWKFLFPFITTSSKLHETLAQLEDCITESVDVTRQHEAFSDISRIMRDRKLTTMDGTIQWLRFVAFRIEIFLDNNKDLFASRSDKGAHTVILNTNDYDLALSNLLSDFCYSQINHNPLMKLINVERNLLKILQTNYKSKEISRGFYQPALLILAKFYGLVKIHKPGFCLRPIMALNCSPGNFLGKIFNKMLNICFPQSGFHFKDSYEAKRQIDMLHIEPDEVLVSFDVVSMYTNIPKKLAFDIVFSKHQMFFDLFGIGRSVLKRILDFLLDDCTVFTALGNTYKQVQGLPMGGSISTNLARLVMDRIVHNLLTKRPEITFIRVFVDDTIAVVKKDTAPLLVNLLNSFEPGIEFTCEIENDLKSINFLNLTLIRENNQILTNWFRKLFASGRLLPFFSSHKRSTIIETAIAFLRTVITLSDSTFFHSNKPIVIETLRQNGFPEELISVLMNNHYTLMRGRITKERVQNPAYKIFPHATCESRRVKKVLHKLKNKNVIYSDSTRNSRVNFITTRKTTTPKEKRGNVIVTSNCRCGARTKVATTRWNENGEMLVRRLKTDFHNCNGPLHAFSRFKFHRGLAYGGQTNVLIKYFAWMNRKGVSFMEIGFPNKHFQPLLRRLKKTGKSTHRS